MINHTDKLIKKVDSAMAYAVKKITPPISDLETQYHEVTAFFDLAEQLVGTVEDPNVADAEKQLIVVEPLISEISEAADILSEEFILIAEATRNRGTNKASKKRIESTLRRIYSAIHEYQRRVREVTKDTHEMIANVADPIVQKIQRQAEHVAAIFFGYVHLSLQNIMNHMELAQLKARETGIALMMHHWAQAKQQ